MKIITIYLPDKYISAIQILKDSGLYPSRSEAVRIALRDFLSNELKFYQEIEDEKFKMFVRSNPNRRI